MEDRVTRLGDRRFGFEIVRSPKGDAEGIHCTRCDRTSWNPEDVRHRFTACCGFFHDFDAPTDAELERIRRGEGYWHRGTGFRSYPEVGEEARARRRSRAIGLTPQEARDPWPIG
jgi:hypothetical protein